MALFGADKYKTTLTWHQLSSLDVLNAADAVSHQKPVLLYKHSGRCHICSMAKNRLELYWDPARGIEPYFLDLIAHRDVSNEIANRYQVRHESPQVLLIKNGKCVYHASHGEIDFNKLKNHL
jgi:bacillithiol system protein YtxJ